MKMNSQQPKPYGPSKGSTEWEMHSNTSLPKKDTNISNKQPNPTPIRIGGTTNKA